MPGLRCSDRTPWTAVAAGLLLVAGYHLLAMRLGWSPDIQGNDWFLNWDTDSYSRLLRVLQLHETGAWYDTRADYFNAPYGMEMHWTRPLDLLLYAGAWVGSRFTDFRTALEIWAMLLCGPLLHLAFVPLLHRATRRTTGTGGFVLLVAMFLSLTQVTALFEAGFIDYHGLLVLLQLAILVLLLPRTAGARRGAAAAAGVLAAVGVWITVEGVLLLAVPAILALALRWVWEGDDRLDDLADFGFAFGAMLTLALLIERPPADWLSLESDRISLLHLLIAVVLSLAVRLLQWVEHAVAPFGPRARFAAALLVGTAGTGVLLLAFPALAGHPQGELGALVLMVLDMQPAEQPYLGNPSLGAFQILRELGPLLLVLPYAAYVVLRGPRAQRRRFLVYLAFLLPMLGYLAFKGRALAFVQIALLLPWLEAVQAIARAAVQRLPVPAARAPVLLPLAALAFAHHVPFLADAARQPPAPKAASCYDDRIFAFLRERADEGPRGTVLAPLWNGPALVYRSGVPVIASPYHRNLQGIEDGFTLLWMEPDAPGIRELAERRGVEYVFLCRSYLQRSGPMMADAPQALVSRLARDDPPPWLRPVALPDGLDAAVLLYRTTSPADVPTEGP